jgi:hypothetical protein
MAMIDLDLTYNDPRTLGSPARRARSWDKLLTDLTNLTNAMNVMRWGHGLRKVIDSPSLGDKAILGFNHTKNDLLFGALIAARLGTGTVTYKLQHGTDLGALVDLGTFVVADNDTGSLVSPADLDALDGWEMGEFLVLEITGTTGAPTQFMIDAVINS